MALAISGSRLAAADAGPGAPLFVESFEDTAWTARGWYDGAHFETVAMVDAPDGERVNVWHWRQAGDIGTVGGGARVHLPPTDDVTLRLAIRFSDNWAWTGVPWHPHMFNFLTSEDWEYVGPSHTHLTTYAEIVNGVPRLAIQDGANVDTDRIGEDLTRLTEARAVAGCNGDPDGHGEGTCYQAGGQYTNGKYWEADSIYFADAEGPRYKGDWHRVQARFRLNSIAAGTARRDGVVQMWWDGVLVIDVHDAVLRTGQHPEMRFNQFLMAPYFGPGVPHEQWAWIDEVQIWATETASTAVEPADVSWGRLKRGP